MPTYRLTIEYEGTRYSGWQAQGNTPKTIQGNLLPAATRALVAVDTGGAGRRAAVFLPGGRVPPWRPTRPLARRNPTPTPTPPPPADINVLTIERPHARFHARHDAVSRVYLYQ